MAESRSFVCSYLTSSVAGKSVSPKPTSGSLLGLNVAPPPAVTGPENESARPRPSSGGTPVGIGVYT